MSKKKQRNKGYDKGREIKKEVEEVEAEAVANEIEETKEKVEEKIEVSSVKKEEVKKEEEMEGQAVLSELDEKVATQKTIKNLISIVILLSGIAVGSFFVDVVQFMSGDGFSEREMKKNEVIVAGDKTWVAYNEPKVGVKILTVGDDEMENCENCDPTEVLLWLKDYVPTMVPGDKDQKYVSIDSEEGQALIEKYEIKSVPAYIFSEEVAETKFFSGEGRVVFTEKDDSFLLNSAGLGIPVGKYLQTPEVKDTDEVLGSKDAKIKVIVFSDFQCPYCGEYFDNVRAAVQSFGEDEVSLVYKDSPLDFHLQANNAAMATRCAGDQEKFWEMGELLYSSQQDWQETEGTQAFKGYARELKMNTVAFNKCMDEKTTESLIAEDLAQAEEIGIAGVPATFVGTQFTSGVVTTAAIKKMIEIEMEKEMEDIDEDEIKVEGAEDSELSEEEMEIENIVVE